MIMKDKHKNIKDYRKRVISAFTFVLLIAFSLILPETMAILSHVEEVFKENVEPFSKPSIFEDPSKHNSASHDEAATLSMNKFEIMTNDGFDIAPGLYSRQIRYVSSQCTGQAEASTSSVNSLSGCTDYCLAQLNYPKSLLMTFGGSLCSCYSSSQSCWSPVTYSNANVYLVTLAGEPCSCATVQCGRCQTGCPGSYCRGEWDSLNMCVCNMDGTDCGDPYLACGLTQPGLPTELPSNLPTFQPSELPKRLPAGPPAVVVTTVDFKAVPNYGGVSGCGNPVGPMGSSGWVAETEGVSSYNPYSNDPTWGPPHMYTVFFQNGHSPWSIRMSYTFSSIRVGAQYFVGLTVARRDGLGVDKFNVSLGGSTVYSTIPLTSTIRNPFSSWEVPWVYANSSIIVANSTTLKLEFQMDCYQYDYESLWLGPVTLYQVPTSSSPSKAPTMQVPATASTTGTPTHNPISEPMPSKQPYKHSRRRHKYVSRSPSSGPHRKTKRFPAPGSQSDSAKAMPVQ